MTAHQLGSLLIQLFSQLPEPVNCRFCSLVTSKQKNAVKSTKKAVKVPIVYIFCCFPHIHTHKRRHRESFHRDENLYHKLHKTQPASAHTQYAALSINNTLCFSLRHSCFDQSIQSWGGKMLRKRNRRDTCASEQIKREREGTVPPAGPYRSAKPLEEKPCFIYSAAYPWKPERSLQARPVFHPCSGE